MQVSQEVQSIVERTRALVREVVLPLDDEHDGDIEAAGGEPVRARLQAAAKEAGVFAPHAPVDCGGLGLGMVDRAPVFEEAGYSLFGPVALNIKLGLRDDRAGAGRRRRPLDARHAGDQGRRRVGRQRPQALHHRRRRSRVLHHHGPHQR